jgi:hypothetical protein
MLKLHDFCNRAGIDCNTVFPEQVVHHQVGYLATDALKLQQAFTVVWYFAA